MEAIARFQASHEADASPIQRLIERVTLQELRSPVVVDTGSSPDAGTTGAAELRATLA